MIHNLDVFQLWTPRHVVSTYPTYLTASNEITFTHHLVKNVRTRVCESSLNLSHSVSVNRSVVNLNIGNALYLSHNAGKSPIYLEVLNGLAQWDRAVVPYCATVLDSLGLVSSLSGSSASKGMSAQLPMTQSVGCKVVRSLSVSNSLAFRSKAASFTASFGSSYVMPVFPPIVHQTLVYFTYGAYTFHVRKPDFDNSTKLEFSRVNRRSVGGDLIIYRDPIWPESITLDMKFSLLSAAEAQLFKTLFIVSLGELVRYDDYLGQTWFGIILNPQEPIVQYGRDRFSVKIQMQGGRA